MAKAKRSTVKVVAQGDHAASLVIQAGLATRVAKATRRINPGLGEQTKAVIRQPVPVQIGDEPAALGGAVQPLQEGHHTRVVEMVGKL